MTTPLTSGVLSDSTRKPPEPWQREAAAAWLSTRHPHRGSGHGIVEAATGLGKTILAMHCMVEASRLRPDLRFVVVVPNRHLARQWVAELTEWFELPAGAVGRLGDDHSDGLQGRRFLVAVIDSARTDLRQVCAGHAVMLVVDECHASAAPVNREIYGAETVFRLGISATAEVTGEVDEDGVVLPLDRQPHAVALGPRCYQLDFGRADRLGLLPPFRIVHHGIVLSRLPSGPPGADSEADRYRKLTHALNQALADATAVGVSAAAVQAIVRYAGRAGGRWTPEQVRAATAAHAAARARKQFLYLLPARNHVALQITKQAFADAAAAGQDLQLVCFHERVRLSARELAQDAVSSAWDQDPEGDDEAPAPAGFARADPSGAERLHQQMLAAHGQGALAIDGPSDVVIRGTYSGREDSGALTSLRLPVGDPGRARVLVSAKAANQGVDLPQVDVGIVVASSSSVRQRIQTLGRILRARREDGRRLPPEAYARFFPKTLHVIYVKDTADEEIYLQTDWEELLGRERNDWRTWAPGADAPAPDDAPPMPPMSEAEAWAWVQAQREGGATVPLLWPSRVPPGQEVSYSHHRVRIRPPGAPRGGRPPVVHNDAEIRSVVDAAAAACGLPSTSFRGTLLVTLTHRLVLRPAVDGALRGPGLDPRTGRALRSPWMVLGQVAERPRLDPSSPDGREPAPPDAVAPTARPARALPAAPTAPAAACVDEVRAFVQSGGEPRSGADVAEPSLSLLLRAGARSAELPPLDHLASARPEDVFAGWAQAAALADTVRARTLEAELARRGSPAARAYHRALRQVSPA